MDYKPVPHDDEQTSVTDQLCDIPSKFTKKGTIVVVVWTIVTVATLISVLTLLLLFTLQGHQSCTTRDDDWSHSVSYGGKRSRMSLDHKYDYLWNDLLLDGFGTVSTIENVADNQAS